MSFNVTITPEQERLLTKVDIIWQPQLGSQVQFLTCPLFEVLYEGTRGPGKTDALLIDFAQYCGRGFGAAWKGILFRQTYPQLQDVISKSKKIFMRLPKAQRPVYNESQHFWRWPDGEMLYFRQFMKPDDYWNYHGHEYPWIGWEELCNWPTDEGYKRMMSCCRSSTAGMPRHYRATTNPYGPGHNWVKRRFRLPGGRFVPITDSKDDTGKLEPPRVALQGHISENMILLKADPEYIDRIRASARNKSELAAWIDGSWDIVAGGMFDDVWEDKVHFVKPFAIPSSWRIDRSFDWGSSKPFSVGWWAESDGSDFLDGSGRWRSSVPGDLYRVYEWYGTTGKPNEGLRMLAVDIAKGILEREEAWGIRDRVQPGPADTSIFDAENGNCIADDMEQTIRLDNGTLVHGGVSWERADKRPGSRKTGWEQMRAAFRAAVPTPGRAREKPGIFIFNNCQAFRELVPVLPRSDKDPDDVNTDAEDHIGDECRYRVREMGQGMRIGRTRGMRG